MKVILNFYGFCKEIEMADGIVMGHRYIVVPLPMYKLPALPHVDNERGSLIKTLRFKFVGLTKRGNPMDNGGFETENIAFYSYIPE